MDRDEIIILIVFIGIILGIGSYIWSLFDHSGWGRGSYPDPNAIIIDCYSERVKLSKNDVRFKTRVEFSDGFYYITHNTNREDHLMSYTISIDDALQSKILKKATEKHKSAVEKKLAKK